MKQRGYSLVEVLTGLALTALLFITGMSVLSNSLRSLNRTDTRLSLSQTNALTLRKVTEEIRSAFSLSVSEDARSITYEMPKLNASADPLTGEKEFAYPMVSDGIARTVYYASGKLLYKVGNGSPKELASEIVEKDPDKNSSYFNQAYPMFAFANVGSANGLKIMLITQRALPGGLEFNRQTLTVLMRNYR